MKLGLTDMRDINNSNETQQLGHIFEILPGMVYTCRGNAKGGMLCFQGLVQEITGYQASEFVEGGVRTYHSLIYEHDREKVITERERARLAGEKWNIEYRIESKENGLRWVRESGISVSEHNNDNDYFQGYIQDITEETRKNRQCLDTEEKLSGIFNNIRDAIWSATWPEMEILYISDSASEIFGYTPKDFASKPNLKKEILLPDDEGVLLEAFRRVKTYGHASYEYRIRKADGGIAWIKDVIYLVFYDNGSLIRLDGISRDVTELKEYERELIAAKELAESANRAKSEFIANISHEIRTPMNSILGFTEIMLNTTTDEKQENYLKTVLDSGRVLLSLINDILDISKIEVGRMEIKAVPTNIRAMVGELQQVFTKDLTEKRLSFAFEIDPNLPETILIDEIRMRQVLLNLIGNAVKFTHKGGITTKVEVLSKDSNFVSFQIKICDTGIGIQEQYLDVIFDSFRQSYGQDNRKYGGTGLGLAISKRLCELMGGKIGVSSTPGIGSTFTLTFNSIEVSSVSVEKEDLYSWAENQYYFRGAKILVVDDVKHNRDLIISYLSQYPLELAEADNGFSAVQIAQTTLPDLILMDIRMPDMDGFEAANLLKQNVATKNVPIIALTASNIDFGSGLNTSNFAGYLQKPVRKNSLVSELETHLPVSRGGQGPSDLKSKVLTEAVDNEIIAQHVKRHYQAMFAKEISIQAELMIVDELNALKEKLKLFAREFDLTALYEKIKELEQAIATYNFDGIQYSLQSISALFSD